MAETKKGKSIDIVSGETKADETARPIIVNRGPIVSDPAIVSKDSADIESLPKEEQGVISQAKTITINPVSSDEAQTKQTPAEGPTPESTDAPADDNKPEVATVTQDKATEQHPKPEPVSEKDTKADTVTAKPAAEETPIVEAQTDAAMQKQELQKEEANKEHLKKLDQMVASEQYFLPINMREKRQNKRVIIIGTLICTLLAVVWVDVALDAGIISNSLHLPHTHFFVSKS